MKKVLILLAIILICASSMVTAQDLKGMFNVSPWAGIGIPMGDFSSTDVDNDNAAYRKIGFKFGAYAEYFFTSNIGAGVDFMWANFPSKEIDGYNPEDKVQSINFGVHGKYVFVPEGMLRPYAVIGGGLTMNKIKDILDTETDERYDIKLDTKMYIMGGIGAMYWVSEMLSIYGEATLDYLLLKNAGGEVDGESVDDAVEANYYFVDIRVGINVWFGGTE